MALKDEMGKMIGPLPMGAWIAVVGGGLAYLYYTRSQSASTAATTTATTDPTDTADTGVGLGGIPAGYTYTGDTSGTSGATGTPAITDNTSWASAAVNYLISVGYDAAAAQTAITVEINGGSPTPTQWTMISAALQHVGALPDPVTTTGSPPTVGTPSSTFKVTSSSGHPVGYYTLTEAYQARNNKGQATGSKRAKGYQVRVIQWGEIGTTLYAQSDRYYYAASVLNQAKATSSTTSKTSASKPAPKPKAKPKTPAKVTSPKATKKTYTVKHNDNLSSIASKYHINWQTLYNTNKSKIGSNPNLIKPGQVLTIP